MTAPRLACLVFAALWPIAASAQLVVREDPTPRVANPADGVPYPSGAAGCRDTIADTFARGVFRAIDQCPETFFESRAAYIAYARQAAIGIFVPGATEAAGALALDKAKENALFCISSALIEESGASAADQAFMKELVAEAKELNDRAEGAAKLAELGKALKEKGRAAYFEGDFNTFVNTLDVTLSERYEGRVREGALAGAGRARYDTPETRARNATEAARALGRECRYAEAEAGLARAQQLNLAYLAELRAEVEKAKHHRYCLERDARQQPINELNPASPFLRHSIESADADVAEAQRRDAEETQFIGELAQLQASYGKQRNDVEVLRNRGKRHLEAARAAAGDCDWARAAGALDTLNTETLQCAVQLDDVRVERETLANQIEEAQRQFAALEVEYRKAIAVPFEQLDSCGVLSVFADTVNQFPGQCRVIAGVDAKVATLRQRARDCADAKTGARVNAAPGTLIGKVEVQPEKLETNIRGSTRSTYGAASHSFERQDDYPSHVKITWNYNGVPKTLTPGQTQPIVITVTGGVVFESPKDASVGYALSGVVAVYGDVTMKSAQQADRGNPVGRYEFVVNPNAQNVEIHLGGYPMGTGAVWKYTKAR